jgi:TRAP-type C4-dicarboxylate transport system permease small subunit
MKSHSWFDMVTGILASVIQIVACFLFLVSVLIAGYEVVMRYVFSASHDWGEELILTTMLYGVFLAAVVALREGKHTRVDVLLLRLDEKKRLFWETFLTLVTVITCGAYAGAAILIVGTLKQNGLVTQSSLAMPYWIHYLVLPISLGLCTLVSMEQMARLISKLVSDRRS